MRQNKEYQLCKAIATYLRYKHPSVIFHFDMAGLNLSKAQAGMNKAIQWGRGWPDLFIAEPGKRFKYHGLFLELKAEGTRLQKRDGDYASEHIAEQVEMLERLRERGYRAEMAVGYDEAIRIIENYLAL